MTSEWVAAIASVLGALATLVAVILAFGLNVFFERKRVLSQKLELFLEEVNALMHLTNTGYSRRDKSSPEELTQKFEQSFKLQLASVFRLDTLCKIYFKELEPKMNAITAALGEIQKLDLSYAGGGYPDVAYGWRKKRSEVLLAAVKDLQTYCLEHQLHHFRFWSIKSWMYFLD